MLKEDVKEILLDDNMHRIVIILQDSDKTQAVKETFKTENLRNLS